jgi:hypothetical protein
MPHLQRKPPIPAPDRYRLECNGRLQAALRADDLADAGKEARPLILRLPETTGTLTDVGHIASLN